MSQVIITQDGDSVPDAYIDSFNQNTNYGTGVNLQVGYQPGKSVAAFRSLLNFHLDSIPSGAIINDATLRLRVNALSTGGTSATVYRLTQLWVEEGVTWNQYDDLISWSTPGGDYTTDGEVPFTTPTSTGFFDITGLSGLVIDGIINRSEQLDIILRHNNEGGGANDIVIDSSQASETTYRPQLIINYTTPFSTSGDLFIAGLLPTEEYNISGDLFIHGQDNIASSGNLFLGGCESYTTSGDLYLYGLEVFSASGDLFVEGYKSFQSSGDLSIIGHKDTTVSGDLYIKGYESITNSHNLFIHGHSDITTSGDLFIEGHYSIESSGDLFISGSQLADTITISGDLFIDGHNTSQTSHNLFLWGHTSVDISGNLFIYGHLSSIASGDLYINGYEVYTASSDLIVTGHEDIAVSGDLYIYGQDIVSSSGDLFIGGHNTTVSSSHLFIHGLENPETSGNLFINGYDIVQISGNLFIHGHEIIQVSGDLYIRGAVESTASCDLFINGYDTAQISGNLYIDGHETYQTSGDLFIFGRDARYCLYSDNVIFYHPCDNYIEDIIQEPWNENIVTFSGGFISSGAITTSEAILSYDNQNDPYPFIENATSFAIAFWSKYFFRTGPDAEIFIGNSSDPSGLADENGIHLHGTNGKPMVHINGNEGIAIGSLNPTPDDDEWHFLVIYAEISGGNWNIYGSIDGGTLNHLTNDVTSTTAMSGQRYPIIYFNDLLSASPPPIIDEVIGWTGLAAPFTQNEIHNLYDLGYIHGLPMDAYRDHFEAGNSISIFIQGQQQTTNSCNLYLSGHEPLSSSGDLFVQSYEVFQSSGDLFIKVQEQIIASGNLFIKGIGVSGSFSESGDLFISGPQSITTSSDLFIVAQDIATTSGNLFITGHDDITIFGNLFVRGYDTASVSGNLFIGAQDSITTSGDLSIEGRDTIQTSGSLYIYGLTNAFDQCDLCISCVQFQTSGLADLFIEGSIGVLPTSGSCDLFISALLYGDNNSLLLFVNGYEPKPALACPILDPTAAIQIKASLIETYQDLIDDVIDQLGKNVLLEFNPISSPCPNCEFDTIRKRSTGVYKIGGPRPFVRGRQCPYCKGRGFTETASTTIIKCLTKWNPEDAETFGIAVSQAKDIVRLKTYLTDADDLVRAKTIIVNYDIVGQMKLRARLIRGPIPVGLREDRYCISFWELI